jgi:hypothetical protein
MPSKEEAEKISEFIGCQGVHRTRNNGWMPCSSPEALAQASSDAEPQKKVYTNEFEVVRRKKFKKRNKRKIVGKDYEQLTEKPIRGITSIPGVGIVTALSGEAGSLS